MIYLIIGKSGDILISFFAPMPPWFCYLHAYIKSLASICVLLALDCIMTSRYMFIFYLQVDMQLIKQIKLKFIII